MGLESSSGLNVKDLDLVLGKVILINLDDVVVLLDLEPQVLEASLLGTSHSEHLPKLPYQGLKGFLASMKEVGQHDSPVRPVALHSYHVGKIHKDLYLIAYIPG